MRAPRRLIAALCAAALTAPLAGCGSDSGPPMLTWYAMPDNGGVAQRAQDCAEQSNGAYRVQMEVLPADATAQREQMVRRLAANDSSIDVLSLDVVYTAEFANAGFLLPFSDADAAAFTEGMLAAPVETGLWKDTLFAVPMKSNAQLLFYRKSVVEAAGVDPTAEDFTWDKMIEAARSQNKTIAEQGARYEGYMVWINALMLSAGGTILDNPEAGREAVPGLDSAAGRDVARIVADIAQSSVAPSDLATAMEEQGRAVFQSDAGMFMPNWPYVLAAARAAAESGSLAPEVVDDIGWARYPRVHADLPSAPPLGGTNLAIGAFSEYPELARDLIACVGTPAGATQYMLDEGEPSPYAASYDDPAIREQYPNADLIRESIAEAGPRPLTPFYVDVTGAIIASWHPAHAVSESTPAQSAALMADILAGRRLL